MLKKMDNETFGKYIERLRDHKGYSQRKLAQVTGISNTTINRIEKNITNNPDLNTLKLLAKHLDVDEIYMLEASGYKRENKSTDLNDKDERDIEKATEQFLNGLEGGVMLNGEILDAEDLELFKQAVKNGLTYAKISNKKKYTPKKYRKNKDNEDK
ncbi:helix-turn-helix domain-containing protein [Clostridium sp. JN-9]|uniref:helix-turn-helix domain-containing protein n=1 Tax=Clostridium sp. JN-9 TaxID=2507159 RepID=UPI000FFDF8B8|nr:helix-turn-helix domain-containing protein [Clostridium sp. JN-9]QAT40874.1 helix-turn-helix domain-containing protein [Clostridium sp. JN-9]